MDSKEFREFGKAAIDFIADYMDTIRERDVLPSVSPGYLFDLLPKEIPEAPEKWQNILSDINTTIMPGLTHWQSPNMHAYYPTATSFPSIVGEMLSSGFGVIGFSWICSPACTELEVVVMDWLAKFLNLPSEFLHSSEGPGGGVIQGSASESVLVAVLAAREQAVKRIQTEHPDLSESEIRGRLMAYSGDQSNSCIEKACVLSAVPYRLLPAGDDLVLHGEALRQAVEEDKAKGLFPIICIATVGTTGTCAYDDVQGLGQVCKEENIWLHVDAAYAGAAFALPEYNELLRGLELVDSLNFNLHKFLLVNFDCCAMWLRDANQVSDSFNVDRIYLKHKYEGKSQVPDYRHWQISLGRRFRALKVWITFRSIGAEGLRAHVRKHIALAEQFEKFVLNDKRFEIVAKRALGLVCFRLRGDNSLTTSLLDRLMDRKKVYLIQAKYKDTHFLRFVVCGYNAEEKDVDFAWKEIKEQAELVLGSNKENKSIEPLKEHAVKNDVGQITEKIALLLSSDCEKLQ
ncbi:3,4-dihydroxyphenylacetaldehyde synthase 2 [Episyrphus balteatus]|uniref:3,4-dihydroxyphenylacetaldehyde synthase 2 n=1 Tax=Episyrphus balteatus TaxID=286459 RepID=UPI0024858D81|nr:3,4-dihydroxyphenylacetaldehyde synthase 2 [Episyrphus balteatus]XP_055837643.1 3,4-dihydroxyphenylacetaldehyde synthase 2 [Episyrphus balteatus]